MENWDLGFGIWDLGLGFSDDDPSPTEPMSADAECGAHRFRADVQGGGTIGLALPGNASRHPGRARRVVNASRRLTARETSRLRSFPSARHRRTLAIKPDAAIGEFAGLLHDRLVGELPSAASRCDRLADALADPVAAIGGVDGRGGIAKAWAASGQPHFEIREIDYAEVLRERRARMAPHGTASSSSACRAMPTPVIDERTLEAVIGALDNPDRFNELLQAVQSSSGSGASIGARAAALLGLIRKAIEVLKARRSTRPGGNRADRRRFGRAHDRRNDALVPARGPRDNGDR